MLIDPFGGAPLLLPRYGSPEAPATGTAFADAMRSAYRYAQTQGRVLGAQVHRELGTGEDQQTRAIYSETFAPIGRFRRRLPAHARTVFASVSYQVFQNFAEQADCTVYHRLSISDGSSSDVGPVVVTSHLATPFSIRASSEVVIDIAHPTSNLRGVFGPYDLELFTATPFVAVDDVDLSDPDNEIVATVEAYAVRTETISAFSDDTDRTSNTVRMDDLDSDHGFEVGDRVWTSGLDEDVPQSGPLELTAVGTHYVEFTFPGPDDADFGDGTVYRATGLPVYHRPGIVLAWWEF